MHDGIDEGFLDRDSQSVRDFVVADAAVAESACQSVDHQGDHTEVIAQDEPEIGGNKLAETRLSLVGRADAQIEVRESQLFDLLLSEILLAGCTHRRKGANEMGRRSISCVMKAVSREMKGFRQLGSQE